MRERKEIRALKRLDRRLEKQQEYASRRRDFSDCAFIIYERQIITDRIAVIRGAI